MGNWIWFTLKYRRGVLIGTGHFAVKNIGEVKFSSRSVEQPTTGRWRKTDPFFSFCHPDILYHTKPVGYIHNKTYQ